MMDAKAVAAIEKQKCKARALPCREEICDIKTFENEKSLKPKFEKL
jgi:hypothetical protein